MVTLRQVANWIEAVAPVTLAETWDHVGLQIGDWDASVSRVMTCLSVTPTVVAEALEKQVDCIISHHPLLFRPLRSIDYSTPLGALVRKICAAGINVYSCHTNYDQAREGLNHHLAQVLGLQDAVPLADHPEGAGVGLGRVGIPSQLLEWEQYLQFVSQRLGAKSVRIIYGTARKTSVYPRRVAVCGGSGGSLIGKAAQVADLYITGDVDYHDALYAQDLGLEVWDFGHFYTEIGVSKWLADLIQQSAAAEEQDLEVIAAESESSPFTTMDNL